MAESNGDNPMKYINTAIEKAIESLEKQEPIKPHYYGDYEDEDVLCPSCNFGIWDLEEYGFNYCPYCGQKLDWSK